MGATERNNAEPSSRADGRPLLKRRLVARRLTRRQANLCRFLLAAPFAVIALIAVILHGLLPPMILGRLGNSLNADVTAKSWSIGLDTVVLHEVTVRSRTIEGRPGEIITIKELTAGITPSRLLSGVDAVSALHLDQPVLRVSFDTASSDRVRTNLAGLRLPETGDGSSAGPALPAISVAGGAIDWGEHTGARFERLRRLHVDGTLQPVADADEPTLALDLRQVLSAAGERAGDESLGLKLMGEIASERISVTLRDFNVADWLRSAPRSVRPLLDDLAIRGNVSQVKVSLEGAQLERASAEAVLDDVALTLPLTTDDPANQGLRLSNASGRLSLEQRRLFASVRGNLAGVPLDVDFDADVSDLLEGRGSKSNMVYGASITIDRFTFGQQSSVLPFLPAETREVLARFADRNQIGAISPTAIVAAEVDLNGRIVGSDEGFGSAVLETYRGVVTIAEGATAFREFPYQFEDVRGDIEFDQDRLRIRSLSGVAPTGARLAVSGDVSPLGDAAGFDMRVRVTDVPIDDALRAAMQPEHRSGLEQVLNRAQYANLVSRALVVPPGQRASVALALAESAERFRALADLGDAAAAQTLVEIERMQARAARAPEIALGGMLDLNLTLVKPSGGDGRWDMAINADVDNAWLVPEQFPLPIRVPDLAVLIDDDVVTVTRGSAVPVNALSGVIEGSIDVAGPEARPNLRFRADRMRVDDLLTYAIGPAGRDPARKDAADIVKRLGLYGDTNAQGLLWSDADGESRFAVEMDVRRIGLLTQPMADRPPLELGDPDGVLLLTEGGLTIDASALHTGLSGDLGVDSPATVQLAIDLDWSDPTRDLATDIAVGIQGLPITAPVEQMLSVFNPEAGAALAATRDAFDPVGMGDAEVLVRSDGSRPPSTSARIMGLRGVSVSQFGGRLDFENPEGRLVVHGRPDGRAHLELGEFRGGLRFEGEDAGRFVAGGTMELSPPDGIARRHREMKVSYAGGRFESLLANAVVRERLSGRFPDDYVSHDARGVFSLDATVVPRIKADPLARDGLERIARVEIDLRPEWGRIFRRGRDIRIDFAEGSIVTADRTTTIDALRGEGDGFSFFADGSLSADGVGGINLEVDLDLEAASLTPDLQALLLEKLNANIEKLGFESPGRISLKDATLRSTTGAGGETTFDGLLAFENASLNLGSPLDGLAGTVRVKTRQGVEDEVPDLLMLGRADRARLAGIEFADARVHVQGWADRPGFIDVPVFSAAGREGGRVWGRGTLTPTADPEAPRYEFNASFTGLNLAAVQDELQAFGEQLSGAEELVEPRRDSGARLEGRLALAGTVQQDETRRGKVSVRIAGGELLRIPVLGRLIEVKALQPPTGESMDFAQADLTVDGTTVTADYISVQSRTVEVFGTGLITLPDFGLDLVLYTRSVSPWPIVSRFADVIFDEFAKVAVTGTAKDPQPSLQTLAGSRRLLGSILSPGGSGGSTELDAVERRAFQLREVRGRYREVRTPARPAKITSRPRERADRVARLQEQP